MASPSVAFAGLRVLLVAKFSRRYHHTGYGILAGLKELGTEVARVDLRDSVVNRATGRHLAVRLAGALRRHRPDLVLSYKGGELAPEVIGRVRPGGRA